MFEYNVLFISSTETVQVAFEDVQYGIAGNLQIELLRTLFGATISTYWLFPGLLTYCRPPLLRTILDIS